MNVKFIFAGLSCGMPAIVIYDKEDNTYYMVVDREKYISDRNRNKHYSLVDFSIMCCDYIFKGSIDFARIVGYNDTIVCKYIYYMLCEENAKVNLYDFIRIYCINNDFDFETGRKKRGEK